MLIRAIAAFIALPGLFAFAIPIAVGIASGRPVQHAAMAAVPLSLGSMLLLWCVREFYVAGRGTLAPWTPPQKLVQSGPYQWSRNPMYISVVTILIGWWTLWGSRTHLIYAVAVALAFHLRVVIAEEPWAARHFGTDWETYRTTVPRWFL